MTKPRKPYLCACGEWRARMFSGGYKSLCSACRATRERERWAAERGVPVGKPRKLKRKARRKTPAAPRASWLDVIAGARA